VSNAVEEPAVCCCLFVIRVIGEKSSVKPSQTGFKDADSPKLIKLRIRSIIANMSGISYNYNRRQRRIQPTAISPARLAFCNTSSRRRRLGCRLRGNGSFLSLFQDRNWQLHGSDLSPTGIEIARKTFPNN